MKPCEKIDAAGVKIINVYSVITCISKEGVCANVMEETCLAKWFMLVKHWYDICTIYW